MPKNVELTLADIRKAIDLIKESKTTIKQYEWGEVEYNISMNPISIKLNKPVIDEIDKYIAKSRNFANIEDPSNKLITLFGLPIVLSKMS